MQDFDLTMLEKPVVDRKCWGVVSVHLETVSGL